MAGLKEIRRRIASVKNTKQITRAMKLVSAAKLRRAQDAALSGRLFGSRLKSILAATVQALPEGFDHPLLRTTQSGKPRRLIVVSGERGLCGAYNTNVLKAVHSSGTGQDVISIGKRSTSGARRFGWNVVGEFDGLSEDPSKWPIEAMSKAAVDAFIAGETDEVTIFYTKFISAMTQQVTSETLLPLSPKNLSSSGEETSPLPVRFDAPPAMVFDRLVTLYVSSRMREAILESKASEHAARMTAMDSATKNAGDLIDSLRLYMNRVRQSAITTELLDILGGAEAVK